MPMYEFAMWGFYTLNTIRFLDGMAPGGSRWSALIMAAALAVTFSVVSDPGVLTLLSGIVLIISLSLYSEPMDFSYAAYTVIMAALIAYVGVWTRRWSHP